MHTNNTVHTSRIFIFDLLRIILVILVVNLHIHIIDGGTSNVIEPLVWPAVPLFVVLSFYFMSKSFLKERLQFHTIAPRIKRLIIPLLFWSFIGFLIHPGLFTIKNIFLQIITGEVVNVPLYYLNLLILFTLLFWLLTYVHFRVRIVIYLFIIIVSFFLQYSTINYHIFISTIESIQKSYGRFIELLPYAVLGIGFGLLKTRKDLHKFSLSLLIIISLVFYILTIHIQQPLGFHYSGIMIFFLTILSFSLVVLLSPLTIYRRLYTWIEKLGKYSFGVYLFHFIVLEFLLRIFPLLKVFMLGYSISFLFIYIVFCYGVCILCDILTRHKFSYLFQ